MKGVGHIASTFGYHTYVHNFWHRTTTFGMVTHLGSSFPDVLPCRMWSPEAWFRVNTIAPQPKGMGHYRPPILRLLRRPTSIRYDREIIFCVVTKLGERNVLKAYHIPSSNGGCVSGQNFCSSNADARLVCGS